MLYANEITESFFMKRSSNNCYFNYIFLRHLSFEDVFPKNTVLLIYLCINLVFILTYFKKDI